jgi:hypothetical protein
MHANACLRRRRRSVVKEDGEKGCMVKSEVL